MSLVTPSTPARLGMVVGLWALLACSGGAPPAPAPAPPRPAEVELAPDELGATVREGWQAWMAGDAPTARQRFARAVRAGLRAGASPQPFVVRGGAPSVTRIGGSTFASGAAELLGDGYGAILFDVVRTAEGAARAAPFRFVKGPLAPGSEGLVLTGNPTLYFASPTGRPIELPAADLGAVVDEGRLAILRTNGVLTAFDLPSGAPRPGPRLPLPASGDEGIPLTEGGNVTLCTYASKAAYSWNPRTNELLQAEGHACAFDARRGRLATLHDTARASKPSFETQLEVRALGSPGVVKASLGSVGDPGVSTLSFDPDSGLLEIVLADLPKRVVRWVDPSTGRTAAPPWSKRPAPSLASLPVGEAGFRADLLRPLRGLERPGRQLLLPQDASPGNWSAGWCRNAVRTVDGSTIALMDAKKDPDPNQGPRGDDYHLLIATADPLRLRAEVPMRLTTEGPWATVLVLGERYAAARWAWTLTVVDLEHGQLRATVDTEASGGVVSLAPGGLLRAGPRLYDLTLPRAFDKGEEALIDPGWLPREVQIKKDPGGVSLWMSREGPAVRLSTTGYQIADGVAAPGWLRCRLGEWILPLEACAQQLPAARLAPATPAEKPRKP